ncbi:MAG: DNA polymerase I [Elusimicrobiota bacterium]
MVCQNRKKIILIDGNSYVHRAYHAVPRLTDADGRAVNAVFGFVKMLKKIIDREKPTHIAVAFDHSKKTFRHEEYEKYKANREEADKELVEQFPRVYGILEALNIKYIREEGFEADDIIATIARKASKKEFPVFILTSDKDMYQLVTGNISILDTGKDIIYDEDGVKDKFGVKPAQIIDYLALVGDSSDNLPGVRGIGPVTARKLLSEYEDLDGIYMNLGNIKQITSEKLQKYREDAYLTRRMVQLVENMNLPEDIDYYRWKGPDTLVLLEQLKKLNFRSMLSDWSVRDVTEAGPEVDIITDMAGFNKSLEENSAEKEISFELISDSGDHLPAPGNISGICFGFLSGAAYYIPMGHNYLGVGQQLAWKELAEPLRMFLSEGKKGLVSADVKEIYKFFRRNDIPIDRISFDAITADYVIDPETGSGRLKEICLRYLNWAPEDIGESPWARRVEDIASIAALRLKAVWELKKQLSGRISEESTGKLYEDVELPVLKILGEMEMSGIKVDTVQMNNTKKDFQKRQAIIEKSIYDIAGETFNVNSSKQLAEILFEKLGLKPIRKTKTGYSTAEDILHMLKNEHELPEKVLEYRKLQKLLSTYIDPLPIMIKKTTGRLHTTFNIAGTVTGRLSSSEPNLQNIPVRSPEGGLIRKTFIPENGYRFVSGDYSQIDLRVLAHISKDKNLIDSFVSGEDIHKRTAARVFEVEEEKVDHSMRKKAKAINFGIVYGMSAKGLSRRANMNYEESQKFIERYFNQYPGIKQYMDTTVKKARKELYVSTLLNRRRFLKEINSANPMRRRLFERMAINTPIQGSSADIIKLAMVELDKELDFNRGPVKLLLQIHDELLFEIPENSVEKYKKIIKDKMESVVTLSVPMVVDMRAGSNWRDMEKC